MPIRHVCTTTGMLLVGGALLNIAVAWLACGLPDAAAAPIKPATAVQLTHDEARRVMQRLQPPDGWPAPIGALAVTGRGWSALRAWGERGGVTRWSGWRLETGWPARSLSFVRLTTPDPALRTLPGAWPEERLSLSLEPPWALLPHGNWFASPRDRLPLTPIPSGFAINTLFYAAVLALPLSFFPIRRRLRARRGRCPKCGYDLAGLGGRTSADPAAPCPECGEQGLRTQS